MNDNGRIGMALVGGYLLGRTKKAKLAVGLGMFLAGRKLSLNPQQLAKMAADSPVIGGLSDQVRKDLMNGTKSALTSAVTRRANSLADSLHERTLDINDPSGRRRRSEAEDGGDGGDDEDDRYDEDLPGDERADDAGDEAGDVPEDDEPQERPRPRPRRKAPASARKPAGAAKTAKSAAGSRSAKSTAGKAAKPASGGRAGGSARERAASGARKATGRGGRNG
ncbi:hypothetical protein ACFPA8_22675 [Streptomyces ovatisporus]|uniref:DNA primase n=1 Tax=Streptomyces ovatisporus TaxID=1128682 RepID=A0ABV9AB77_9ACTN